MPARSNPQKPIPINFVDKLTRPHPSITDVALRSKSRLLARILLVMTLVFGVLDAVYLITVPNYEVPWYGYIFLSASFLLNYYGYYRYASGLALLMFPMVIFANVVTGEAVNPIATLDLTILSVMLGGILLSRRGLLILTGINLAGILLMPSVVPDKLPGLTSVISPASAMIIATLLSLIFTRQRDQIEQKRQGELREKEERLQLALQAGQLGAWEWNILSGELYWSKEVEHIFGLAPGEFKGTLDGYLSILPEAERLKVEAGIRESLHNKDEQYHVIHRYQNRKGDERWLETRGNIFRDNSDAPIRMTGTITDITTRLEADNERAELLGKMEKRNAHLNAATRVSKFCNLILDPKLLTQQACDMIAEGFDLYYVGLFLLKDGKAVLQAGNGEAGRTMIQEGYFLPETESSMIGWSILNQRARIAQRVLNDEVRRDNPHLPDTRSEMALPLISRGRVIGALTVQSDVEDAFEEGDIAILQTLSDQLAVSIENARLFSELQNELQRRLQSEMDLERERDFAVLVMNALGQGVIVTDEEARLEYVNPAFARMIGIPQEQLVGRRPENFVHPEDREKLKQANRPDRKTSSFEARFIRANGQVAHVLITTSRRQANDQSRGAIAAMIDLTERKQAELERESLIRELEGKNAELERFTYTVSHDLKSPLITIRGFLGYLLDDVEKGDLARMREDAKRISDATNRMQRLLDDLLEVSRVGRIINPPEDIPFEQLVHEALALVEGRIAQGGIRVEIGPRLPIVRADRVRVVEALQNLLDNSAKFMGDQPNPKIEIGADESSGQTVLFVKDNGIGIDPKYHSKIFGLFDKLEKDSEGAGVGLALVKRIIEVHGGRIWVESAPGQGTTFFFTLESARS